MHTLIYLLLAVLPAIAMAEKNDSPPAYQDADTLYQYGLFLQQRERPSDISDAARYYRVAAAHGHYKAATNLQTLITQGLAHSPNGQKEALALVEKFMTLGVPSAYYDMAHYLEAGYGVEKANAYFRKAADLGSPDAQYYAAALLGRVKGGAGVMEEMLRCAAYQGHASAARELAGYIRESKRFEEAIRIYHLSTKSGDSASARRLSKAFEAPPPKEELYYLGLDLDKERSDRYRLISKFLQKNEQLGSKLPDIDSIVPLPPAKLPAWDGTFQWQKERDAISGHRPALNKKLKVRCH
ncbi:Sel1 repeat-containing protein [Pseudomonas syringae pv. actinidiae ICMP 19072]|nr:Sel1 repeat-containing protein [Pseudomonas syringae pv. actinidiae ICMP 19072]